MKKMAKKYENILSRLTFVQTVVSLMTSHREVEFSVYY